MDQKERIEQLKVEIHRLAGGKEVLWGIERLPPDVAVAFLERIIAVEKAAATPPPDSADVY